MNWECRSQSRSVRWTEIRRTAVSYSIYQQGTYSPDDTHCWMGSIEQENFGNITLGYSVTSAFVFPGIRCTGRVPTDPLGMAVPEATLVDGSQNDVCAWGECLSMNVDQVMIAHSGTSMNILQRRVMKDGKSPASVCVRQQKQ
jgi:hypothetical protein